MGVSLRLNHVRDESGSPSIADDLVQCSIHRRGSDLHRHVTAGDVALFSSCQRDVPRSRRRTGSSRVVGGQNNCSTSFSGAICVPMVHLENFRGRRNMNWRNALAISTVATLGLALLPTGAVSQQKSLKEQLVGTWTLVSLGRTASDGTKRQIPNPKGILILDAGGRYAQVAGRGDRPKFKSPSQPTTEELAAATQDFFAANFGTWSVNEADNTLTQRFDGALRPNNEGTDTKNSVSLAGDELKLTGVVPGTGTRVEDVYRRAR
jgi:hypothetical protein